MKLVLMMNIDDNIIVDVDPALEYEEVIGDTDD